MVDWDFPAFPERASYFINTGVLPSPCDCEEQPNWDGYPADKYWDDDEYFHPTKSDIFFLTLASLVWTILVILIIWRLLPW